MRELMHPALVWVTKQLPGYGWRVTGFVMLSLIFAAIAWLIPQMLEDLVNKATAGEFDQVTAFAFLGLLALSGVPVLFGTSVD